MLTSLVIIITGGLAASFAQSYLVFVLLRFYISFGVSGSFQSGHIMGMKPTVYLVSTMFLSIQACMDACHVNSSL